jgi:hypothetical protein
MVRGQYGLIDRRFEGEIDLWVTPKLVAAGGKPITQTKLDRKTYIRNERLQRFEADDEP